MSDVIVQGPLNALAGTLPYPPDNTAGSSEWLCAAANQPAAAGIRFGLRCKPEVGERLMTMQVPYSVLLVWLVGPALILTIFGVALFRRYRTVPSALVALGFAAVFVSGLINVVISYDVSHIYGYSSNLAATAVSVQLHGAVWLLARLWGPVGMWVASLSLLWHMFSTRRAASAHDS